MQTDVSEVTIAAIGVDRFSGNQSVFLTAPRSRQGVSVSLTAGQATALVVSLEDGDAPEQSPYASLASLLRDNNFIPHRVLVTPVSTGSTLFYHDGVESRRLEMSAGEGTVLAAYLDLPLLVPADVLDDLDPTLVSRRSRMDVLYFSTI